MPLFASISLGSFLKKDNTIAGAKRVLQEVSAHDPRIAFRRNGL